MAQIGKCSNRVGCTLAYTGQEIRFEGSPICPECGQPLTELTKPKKSSKLWILILIPIVLLALAAVGFYAVERYVAAVDAAKTTPTATPAATAVAQSSGKTDQSGGKMVDGKSTVPADVLNKAQQSIQPIADRAACLVRCYSNGDSCARNATIAARHERKPAGRRPVPSRWGIQVPITLNTTMRARRNRPTPEATIPHKRWTRNRRRYPRLT